MPPNIALRNCAKCPRFDLFAGAQEIQALHLKASEMLSKFLGGTNQIEEETFVHFDDFLKWAERKIKNTMSPETEKELVTTSWNCWVDAHSGDGVAVVAGVPVYYFECYMDDSAYYLCQSTDEQIHKREQLLKYPRIYQWKPDQKENEFQLWRELALNFFIEIYSFSDAVAFVSKHYFDGYPLLFPDYADTFKTLLEETMQLVDMFNDLCREQGEQSHLIDLKEIRKIAGDKAREQVVKMVDMA